MASPENIFEKVIFNQDLQVNRFTQDSPVYAEVWTEFFRLFTGPGDMANPLDAFRVDMILTPYRSASVNKLAARLKSELSQHHGKNMNSQAGIADWRIVYTGETIAARLSLRELVCIVIPMTYWFFQIHGNKEEREKQTKWLQKVVGCLIDLSKQKKTSIEELVERSLHSERWIEICKDQIGKISPRISEKCESFYSVSINRKAEICLFDSVPATKADAACRLFEIDGSSITWAVLDTGIDASHTGFAKPMDPRKGTNPLKPGSRVLATYDFTRFRDLMTRIELDSHKPAKQSGSNLSGKLYGLLGYTTDPGDSPGIMEISDKVTELQSALASGRILDWDSLSQLLQMKEDNYIAPVHPHGTHVAGIIGAAGTDKKAPPSGEGPDGPATRYNTDNYPGMCPGINLYDIRVLDKNGHGEEFNILAALQFIRWLNSRYDQPVIHGINLSMALFHDVRNYACGRTPVCDACIRLVNSGTVVVAAAGNQGQSVYTTSDGHTEAGFRTVCITDPGNAEDVITVGSTHKSLPHTYGVSYFSSRGPTGDGRCKPDIVAPGEKIYSTVPDGGYGKMEGTSMAAPHVSGAAALVMAKYPEMIGQPMTIKKILCNTATDLGRERNFQGHGLVDVLRALQSI